MERYRFTCVDHNESGPGGYGIHRTYSQRGRKPINDRSGRKKLDDLGYGRFAVEVIETRELIGFIGLAQCKFESHFTPAVEIGWRLAHKFLNLGYATEGSSAVIDWASGNLPIDEIVAFTSASNIRSCRVMEKIGMARNVHDDFQHPNLAPSDPLRLCQLYIRQLTR